jgi:hypothetical protein
MSPTNWKLNIGFMHSPLYWITSHKNKLTKLYTSRIGPHKILWLYIKWHWRHFHNFMCPSRCYYLMQEYGNVLLCDRLTLYQTSWKSVKWFINWSWGDRVWLSCKTDFFLEERKLAKNWDHHESDRIPSLENGLIARPLLQHTRIHVLRIGFESANHRFER